VNASLAFIEGAKPHSPADQQILPRASSEGTRPPDRRLDQLVGELEEARDYLKSEEERIRAATARYTALTQAASASVKVIFV
jgi:hypothetical protein